MTTEKEKILKLLDAFIRQRPGLVPGNYDSAASYRSEMRSIARDRHQAEELLRYVAARDSITAEHLREGFRAYSGRLTLKDLPGGRMRLDYCTGQYFPTEYRCAVCAVLASTIWDWTREKGMPAPDSWRVESYTNPDGSRERSKPMQIHAACALAEQKGAGYYVQEYYGGLTAGDWLRRRFRREFGRTIAARWFD